MEKEHMPGRHIAVVIGAFVFIAVVLGLANNLYTLYMIPLTKSLGFSRSAFSLAKSVSGLMFMLSNSFFVMFYRRYGFRKPATLFTLLTALGYAGYSIAEGLFPFFLGAVLFGIGESFLNSAGISMLISNWFHSHQGQMLGIVLSASGLGGAALSVVLGALIESAGWRATFLLSALLLVLAALIVFFVLKDHPEECKLTPYAGHEQGGDENLRAAPEKLWKGIPFRVLRHTRLFYIAMIASFIGCMCVNSTFTLFVVHIQDNGIAPTTAATCSSVMLFALAGGKITLGRMSDHFGSRMTMLLCMGCGIVGTLLLLNAAALPIALASAVLLGINTCMSGFMQPLMAMDMFGPLSYSEMVSALMAMLAGSNIIASPLTNMVYDRFGSYKPVLLVFIALSVLSTALFMIAYRMADGMRSRGGLSMPIKN